MALPYHVRYRLFRRQMALAAELPATAPDRRAWVGVYPYHDSSERFRVLHFEVKNDVLEQGWELSERDLLNMDSIVVAGESELEETLTRWLDDLDKLVQPYFCDYPW